jgi:phosphoribosylformimino-5-aminoimidazole carboxamide ribotide isomerase
VILYPAIDILDGQAVRLVEGDFDARTIYHDDPLEAARSWVAAGARFLHVVDLDGARSGEPQSIEHLRRIVRGTGVPVQYGGGLRTLPAVREALRAGAERAIVGTAAFRDVDFLDDILAAFGSRIVVSVDVRGGHISTSGWTQTTQMPAPTRCAA